MLFDNGHPLLVLRGNACSDARGVVDIWFSPQLCNGWEGAAVLLDGFQQGVGVLAVGDHPVLLEMTHGGIEKQLGIVGLLGGG